MRRPVAYSPPNVFDVLVYLYEERDRSKQARAREVLQWMEHGELVVSTQVLQEFCATVLRKLNPPMPVAELAAVVASFSRSPVVVVEPSLILAAIGRSRMDRLSYWDAVIVESALSAGCDRLLTEGLQHGRQFGSLRVENPFRA